MAQFVGADLLLDPRLLEHPPQVGAGRRSETGFCSAVRANTNSPLGGSLSQNPNTWPNAAGSGPRRSLLPWPETGGNVESPVLSLYHHLGCAPAPTCFSSNSHFGAVTYKLLGFPVS
jgi:hypothetical protein